ncbi:sigma-70 family RNA polymerase sigma factor [Lyngbya confervoides]|uniref:Sigma-70 family RNA polymerase sigma factor n=1 Tax=Lyngbya confervoides BDU141951 TaxID=1574623 RepID=A0ABD4T6S3_9CYAN|nr:sigma-70 family RNA polymerase sigma factor [Lyngbya confervoides]MCM1984437.1 sigma-70 family RNA polymerase sigma factor [Lyngbya confervoides BDU141951]
MDQNQIVECCDRIKTLAHLSSLKPAGLNQSCLLSPADWAHAAGLSEPELNRAIKLGRIAQRKLYKANRGLIVAIALEYRTQADLDDLIQEGFLGLMKAARRFDPTKGHKFSTYAFWWIRDAIQVAAKSNFLSEENRNENQSFDNLGDRGGDPLELQAQGHTCPPIKVESPEIQHLRQQFGFLSEYEQQLLRYRFGLDGEPEWTLKEIGHEFNISHETARRHLLRTISKLRNIYAFLNCA